MPSAARRRRPDTLDDLLAIPEPERFHEIIDGELIRKAMPSFRHGRAQSRLSSRVGGLYDRPPGRRGPGGWYFASEVEVILSPTEVPRPDLSGWRRERLPDIPEQSPVSVRPDWICEILSPTNPENDLFKKLAVYQRAEVPHYWILDPVAEALAAYQWTPNGYLLVAVARGDERVRVPPFEAVELSIHGLVAGDEDDDEDP